MSASSTERTRLSTWIRGHLTADLVILIVTACLNILWALIWTPLAFSSAFAFAVSLYAISNISGTKFGELPCMHILRKMRLRSQGNMIHYQESCLKSALLIRHALRARHLPQRGRSENGRTSTPLNRNLKYRPNRYDPIGFGVSLPPIQSRKNKSLPNNFPEA